MYYRRTPVLRDADQKNGNPCLFGLVFDRDSILDHGLTTPGHIQWRPNYTSFGT